MKCYIKGNEYQIAEGAVFTECYNETLDSGTIILPQLHSKIDIEPYDIVVITGDNINTKRMCVDSYTCTQVCLNPLIYQYEISLFSETKLLEGILLPSLSITKLKNGNLRNIIYYIKQYVSEYANYITVPDDIGFTNECPEFQWNEPTLREVLTDLMMVNDSIPVLHNNTLGYINISEVKDEITDFTGINYIQESQSSADYLSELKMNLKNVTGATNVVYDKISFRNYEAYLLTTENVVAETNSPIYKLNHVDVIGNLTFAGSYYTPEDGLISIPSTDRQTTFDLTDYILEYGEWQTKDIYYAGFDGTEQLSTQYQNTCLYYTRNQRGIHNFNAKQDYTFFWINSQISVLELVYKKLSRQLEQDVREEILEQQPDAYDFNFLVEDPDYKKMMFNIIYDTLCEQTVLVSKTNKFGIRQVVDNQTQSYVDITRQGLLEYFKANRLGNKLKLINARYDKHENEIPQLANKINGSIIFQKQIAIYENHINANYCATENYVLRDYFTGVKAKLRSWPILSGNEAFTRSDIIKFFVNENIDRYVDANSLIPSYDNLNEYITKFNYCLIQFKDAPASYFPRGKINFSGTDYDVDAFQVEFQKSICGNSVLFTMRMYDNALVGKYISDDNHKISDHPDVYSMTQQNCKYVDENGENLGGKILFYQSKESISDSNQLLLSKLLPYSNTDYFTGLVAEIPFTFHKDNKEITQITIQFELNEDANDIFLGRK